LIRQWFCAVNIADELEEGGLKMPAYAGLTAFEKALQIF
jgi:hypothetical protein